MVIMEDLGVDSGVGFNVFWWLGWVPTWGVFGFTCRHEA